MAIISVSNKTLVLLLAFGIVFSVGATVFSLNNLQYGSGITGMVTNSSSGYVNLSVTGTTAVNLTQKGVDFGSGYVSQGCNNCTVDTQGGITSACCVGITNTGQTGLVIENTGNTNLQIDINFSKGATAFIGGSNNINEFKMLVVQNETKSCKTLGSTWSSAYANVPTYNGVESAGRICDLLTPNQANDTIRVHINITIPDNAPSGAKNTSVLVTGTSS